ncbi:hypothetical protein NEOLEDRAFT_1032687, partial [Neolentinus lepideus HHB14362 ss-1]
TAHAYFSARIPDIATWHRRLGHTNPRTITEMAQHGSVQGMRIDLSTQPPKCDHCILGKQVKNSPPKARAGEKATSALGIIYADL